MSSIIKIKRSSVTTIVDNSTALPAGELALTDIGGSKKLYVGDVSGLAKDIAGDSYAKLLSPIFTGTPTAPTPATSDDSTQIATTEFVKNQTIQNAYDNSFPSFSKITTNSNQLGLQIQNGSAFNDNNILQGLNTVGTVTFSLAGDGSVDLLKVSFLNNSSTPSTPSSGFIFYSKEVATPTPTCVDNEGKEFGLEKSFKTVGKYYWNQTNATTGLWIGTIGAGAGTYAKILPTFTSIFTQLSRSRYSNVVTTLNQVLGQRNTELMFFYGNTLGAGGLNFSALFGFDTWTNGGRLFAGFHTATTVISANPSVLNNTIGFCVDSGDAGLISFMTRSGTATSKVSTGLTITSGKGYQVDFVLSSSKTIAFFYIKDINTGAVGVGSVATNLPVVNTLLTAGVLASNAALTTVNAIQLSINRINVEV